MVDQQPTSGSRMTPRYDFASDNTAPATPEVMEAILRANAGFASAYGDDHITAQASDRIRAFLDVDAEIWFTASGTAANSLALTCLAQPHEAVLCHKDSHIATDETGAPGMYGAGVGLIGLKGHSGLIDPAALVRALGAKDSAHAQGAAALSVTNTTEYGTLYSLDALRTLIEPVKDRGYGVHVDGARLAQAAAAGLDLKAMVALGVDILVMGGTKAGATPSEAIVLLNQDIRRRFGARLKHYGQLASKHRYLSAPWLGLLSPGDKDVFWIERAAHAHHMAVRLADRAGLPLRHPVEANAVFVDMAPDHLRRLNALGWNVYRVLDGSVRLMCSWATSIEAVEEFAAVVASSR
jgi:threonine aldolase